MRRIRTAIVDVAGELPDLDLAAADEWRILVTWDGAPLDFVVMASPGAAGPETLALTLRRVAERVLAEEATGRRLPPPAAPAEGVPELRVSVVVPTRRRPAALSALLESVAQLDPAPAEVIVVDNDPGEEDCRAPVESAGACYIREDRCGLNIARNSGLSAATGDVVVFTDDDCIVTQRWLAPLPGWFADPLVGVVAGPGFAHELETEDQLHREEEAGFDKGMRRRRFDWRGTAPAHAGIVGSGNSMAMRRELAEQLRVFTPELDAGTPAPAAGDLYAIYRFLAAGYDAVYEPRMAFFHRHPVSGLGSTIRNYGLGVGAYYTKVLVENRELPAVRFWYWFVRRWLEAVLDALTGAGDRGRVRVRWSYLRASLGGPRAWQRSIGALDADGRAELTASRARLHGDGLAVLAVRRGRHRESSAGRAEIRESVARHATLEPVLDMLEWLRFRGLWWRLANGSHAPTSGATLERAGPATVRATTGTREDPPLTVVHAPPESGAVGHWRAIAAALDRSETQAFVVPLHGASIGSSALGEIAIALQGSRVAAVVGAGLTDDEPPAPLELYGRPQSRMRYAAIGSPPQFIAVRRDLCNELGGLDPQAATVGWHGPVTDFVERALAAGFVVGRLNVHGIDPPGTARPARSANEWQRARARAGLLGRDARGSGAVSGAALLFWSGLVPILRFRRPSAVARKGLRHTAGSLAAFAVGAVSGLRRPA